MTFATAPIYKEAPFIRYIVSFIPGIILQWYYNLPLFVSVTGAAFSIIAVILFSYYRISTIFRFYYLSGISIYLLVFFTGCIITYFQDVRNDQHWVSYHIDTKATSFIVTVDEPPSEKPKSYKTLAQVRYVIKENSAEQAHGKIILYIKKDSTAAQIRYGSMLLVKGQLKAINNFPNATGFNYQKYCGLQNIYHQMYVKKEQYVILPCEDINLFFEFPVKVKDRKSVV